MLNCLRKWLPIIVQVSLTKRYIRISMTIPYCGKACAACGTYAQLSSYVQSEITTLISSSFPSFAATEAGWEPGNKTTHSVLNVN